MMFNLGSGPDSEKWNLVAWEEKYKKQNAVEKKKTPR